MRPNIILICFFVSASLFSQEQRTIEIIQAGKSIRNSTEYPDANILQKDKDLRVILFHDGARIESDVYKRQDLDHFLQNYLIQLEKGLEKLDMSMVQQQVEIVDVDG